MTRQSGYYWLKLRGESLIGWWWQSENKWIIMASVGYCSDEQFDQINETRILAPGEVSDV